MFGYIAVNRAELSDADFARYRAFYCGLCRALSRRHGQIGRLTLTYDMTFLYLLLSSLYEPEERCVPARCALHPLKRHDFIENAAADYAADMNVLLAFHKCRDNWHDDRNLGAAAEGKLLQKAYRRVERDWPEKCAVVAACLERTANLEREKSADVDALANETGRMLGEVLCYKDDIWGPVLRAMGEALGRFIYLMDAYDDLPEDERRGRYNPLFQMRRQDDYEDFCRQMLTMMIAGCTQEFEKLPLVQDIGLLRNVLYSGVWCRYALIQQKRGGKEQENHG